MFMPSKLIIALSVSLQADCDTNYNSKPYQPYTVNHIITVEEMYDTTKLIEKIFMQDEEGL